MLEDVFQGRECSSISRCVAQSCYGIGQRMRLELETDLDDIEGSNNESRDQLISVLAIIVRRGQEIKETHLETKPATAPAAMTWTLEP